MPKRSRVKKPIPADRPRKASELRIIGGHFRGRKLKYHGQLSTRPMKDRVREAVFNLVGPSVADCHAIDLFAGTGALGLEALSRGAKSATFVERHFPTAAIIRENIATLDVGDRCRVSAADTFIWTRNEPDLPDCPWVVFVSPPYDLYIERAEDMLELVASFCRRAPSGSSIVVEADRRFDFAHLPDADQWDVRSYPPAWVGIVRIDRESHGT